MKSLLKKIVVTVLTWQARVILKKYKPKIAAVTGSVGKTSTKDAIYSVLSEFFFVRKSQKSYNSEIGVPLAILGRPNAWGNVFQWLKNVYEGFALIFLPNKYPEWLVLEIGADRPGDIQKIADWVKPDIAVMTRLSQVPVHVEFFRSVSEVILEKSFLIRSLKYDGTVILNSDDEDVLAFQGLVESKKILYGTKNPAQVSGNNFKIEYGENREPRGISFTALYDNESAEVFIKGSLGIQQMYPALAAISVGVSLNLSFKKMAKILEEYNSPPGRMKLMKGIKNSVIIDDSYNSSPVALEEALKALKLLKVKGKKIAILGDMLELGIHSTGAHKKAGEQVARAADVLITSGIRARFFAEGALTTGMPENNIFQFDDSRDAGKFSETLIEEGDVILIKGSQSSRMERAVEEIMAQPENKTKLLVRQEKEWVKR
jgi:UDP-N-acetylmuramoyl-tripeptide--D-alanyl-D-alanine ligase